MSELDLVNGLLSAYAVATLAFHFRTYPQWKKASGRSELEQGK